MAGAVIERINQVFEQPQHPGAAAAADSGTEQAHAELEAFLEQEIAERISRSNMTWRKLELCFKWAKLRDYLGRRGLGTDSDAAQMVRSLLRDKQLLDVDYDARGQVVTKLNHEKCSYIDAMPPVTPAVGG